MARKAAAKSPAPRRRRPTAAAPADLPDEPAPNLWDTVPEAAVESLVISAQEQGGSITLDDALSVLGEEMTEDVVAQTREFWSRHGVAVSEEIEVDAEVGVGLAPGPEPVVTRRRPEPRTPTRRRPTRSSAASASTTAVPNDPVRQYLTEIGQVQLLDAEGEVALAKRIVAGVEAEERLADLNASGEVASLTPAERGALTRAQRDGQRAKEELTSANLRLVVSIAKRYTNRNMALLDLVQEGNLGLMRAVEKFDHTRGFKFSTYATWWIRQAITRAIADQGRTIRIPVHMVESINKVQRIQRQLTQDLEREPTVEEIARKCDMTPQRVREIMRISQDPLSLDQPVNDEHSSELADTVADAQAVMPADVATAHSLQEQLMAALDELTDRDKEVIRLRFGLDDGRPQTLEEVGRHFGVTRERIRQIEAKTLAKLRHPQRRHKLEDFLRSD